MPNSQDKGDKKLEIKVLPRRTPGKSVNKTGGNFGYSKDKENYECNQDRSP